ncbi:MAG: DUF4097 domain-containing protein [Acidobacteria bacterium]|nr:DUF4097 domain-containing protein [Acidobacteriota bacterium]
MKASSLPIILVLMAALSANASAQKMPAPPAPPVYEPGEAARHAQRSVAAESDVVVSLCLASGGIVVRGWDRREVRARSSEAEKIELSASPAQAARRVDVLVSNDEHALLQSGDCGGTGSIELDVPRGATVNLQVRDGDVEVSDVAEARVESLSGDVNLLRVSKGVEASCMSGDISLADSAGRVRLRSVSGEVEASNVRTVEASDDFSAVSTSGDVTLDRIAHTQVKGATISGSVRMTGALARGGGYEFKTTSGDVTLTLPADSSFRVNARVVASGDIVTDFPVRATLGPGSAKELHQSRLVGTVGTGDADLNLTTFSGTVNLKRQ